MDTGIASAMSSQERKEVSLISDEKLELYMSSKPETYHTVINVMTGSGSYTDFLRKGCTFFTDFEKGLIQVSKLRNTSDTLLEFIQQVVVKNEIQLGQVKQKFEAEVSYSAIDGDTEVDKCSPQTDDTTAMEELWQSIPFLAIENNRFDILDICFETESDMNAFYWHNKRNMLTHTLNMDQVNDKMVTYLIKHNLNNNSTNDARHTPLQICIKNVSISAEHKLALVKELIASGGMVNTHKHSFCSVLHTYIDTLLTATDKKAYELWKCFIDEFINCGLDINDTDWFGVTPLMHLISGIPTIDELTNVRELQLELLEYLLSKGADLNIKDYRGHTCAHQVVKTLNIDVLAMLLKFKCDANAVDAMHMTPIYTVCSESEWSSEILIETYLFPIVRLFVESGCDINTKGMDNSSVLHYSAAVQPTSVCQQLCELGANVSAEDYLGRTPLHMAARNKDSTVVDTLVRHKADVNATDLKNDTPLHYACLLDNVGVAKRLVDNGANTAAVGNCAIQPIHLAAENGSHDLIEYFASETNMHALDEWGATPLHYAASDGNIVTVEQLLKLGADKNIRDTRRLRPLDLAQYRGHLKVTTRLADNENDARFGNLPITCFPNRPLLKIDEIDDYFNDLTCKFMKEGITGSALCRRLLECPGLGIVDLNSGEAKVITDKVMSLIEQISKRIGQLDPVFKCKVIRAGSTIEGVKTGYPDEFDFVCHTEYFSTYIERIEVGDTEGFARIMMKTTAPKDILKFCPRKDFFLNSDMFLKHFAQLYRHATYDVLQTGVDQIYTGYMLLPENSSLFVGPIFPFTKLQGHLLSFRGEFHKFLEVSVDINPVLFMKAQPTEMITECALLPHISSMGIYLIPKYCIQLYQYQSQEQSATDLWRYSTNHIEAAIMNMVPQIARDCYTLCKVFRVEPLTCGVKYNSTDQREFSDKQLMSLQGRTMTGAADDDECSETEDEDGDADGKEDSNGEYIADKDSISTENDLTTGHAADESDFDANMSSDDDDFEWEEAEINAENEIPSYYLKSIFIKEAELMTKSGQVFNEESLSRIPRRVYEKLKQGLEENNLTTLFMPRHNMYHKYKPSTDELNTDNLKEIFCGNILKFMDTLGFKDQA